MVDLVLSSSAKTRLSWSIFAIIRSISDGNVDTLPVIFVLFVLIVSSTSPVLRNCNNYYYRLTVVDTGIVLLKRNGLCDLPADCNLCCRSWSVEYMCSSDAGKEEWFKEFDPVIHRSSTHYNGCNGISVIINFIRYTVYYNWHKFYEHIRLFLYDYHDYFELYNIAQWCATFFYPRPLN